MISIKDLITELQTKLNDAIPASGLNFYKPNTNYLFNLVFEEGEYKKAERVLNTTTKYINGVVEVRGDDKSGVTDETVIANISASIEILVPDINETLENISFKDAVRDLIDDTLAASTEDYITQNKIKYYVGTTYSIANTGMLNIRHEVGESITYTIYVSYTIIATGISSQDIKIYCKDGGGTYKRIYPTRLDLVRSSVQESNIPSSAYNTDISGSSSIEYYAAKATTSATTLSIALAKPLRNDWYDGFVKRYIVKGGVEAISIKVEMPDGEMSIEEEYTMCFSDASIAAEGTLAASCNATLVEALDLFSEAEGT
jgi:hypothetical protein